MFVIFPILVLKSKEWEEIELKLKRRYKKNSNWTGAWRDEEEEKEEEWCRRLGVWRRVGSVRARSLGKLLLIFVLELELGLLLLVFLYNFVDLLIDLNVFITVHLLLDIGLHGILGIVFDSVDIGLIIWIQSPVVFQFVSN